MWLGQVVVLIGGSMSLFHYVLFKQKNPEMQFPAKPLMKGGLLGYIRHPMYAGDCLMFSGFWLMMPMLWSLPILVFGLLAIVRQAHEEDAYMFQQFPQQLQVWKQSTGLLFPKFY